MLQRIAAWVIAWLIRIYFATVRVRVVARVNDVDPRYSKNRYLYSVWHENVLIIVSTFSHTRSYLLVSRSRDGNLISGVIERMGLGTIRGSTSRGAVAALREMEAKGGDANLAISPDGPRGPRRTVQPGIVYVAARTGLKICTSGVAYDRPWRAKSWDRLALPRPFSRAVIYGPSPIAVPPDAPRDQLQQYCRLVEQEMDAAEIEARRLLAEWTGRPVESLDEPPPPREAAVTSNTSPSSWQQRPNAA